MTPAAIVIVFFRRVRGVVNQDLRAPQKVNQLAAPTHRRLVFPTRSQLVVGDVDQRLRSVPDLGEWAPRRSTRVPQPIRRDLAALSLRAPPQDLRPSNR